MKNFVIRLVKNNPVLYRGAKKVYRTFQPAGPTVYRNHDLCITYIIQNTEEMPQILAHYNSLRRENTRIVVLVAGNTLKMHGLFRRYPGVTFYSVDYCRRYRKQINIKNMILTDAGQAVSDIIELF